MSGRIVVSPAKRRRPILTLVDMALPPGELDPAQAALTPAGGNKWPLGITWRPELCGGAWGTIDGCVGLADDGSDIIEMIPEVDQDVPEYDPVQIFTREQCPSLSSRDIGYYADRVTDALTIATPKLVGLEFWDAPVSRGLGIDNPHLAQAGLADDLTPNAGAVSISSGYAILERFLGSCGFGQLGMIHATRDAVPEFGVRRPAGTQMLLTWMDTLVVPDPGYPGTGPGNVPAPAGETWLYATGLVTVRISDIESTANGERITPEIMFPRQNRVEVQASRYIAPTWDGDCCVGAVRVQLGN